MSDNTAIEWTDRTWNILTGCTRVSAGCDNCYIARTPPFRMAGRKFDGEGPGSTTGLVFHPERMNQPLGARKPQRWFVNSLADLFHEDVPDEYLSKVFEVMEQATNQTFQILTKRPARMRSFVQSRMDRKREYADKFADCPTEAMRNSPAARWARQRAEHPPANIWLGVSIEDQRWANNRIPALLETPAAVRFLSCEPLLGPISLVANTKIDTGTLVDWVIVGGESGPGARPMHPQWARQLRMECTENGIPFLFKQWGEWVEDVWVDGEGNRHLNVPGNAKDRNRCAMHSAGMTAMRPGNPFNPWQAGHPNWTAMKRVGKKAAGRQLDGRTWDEFPQAVTA